MSTIINTKIHTFAAALACKRDNDTLSAKTLKKLTVIANREFGGDATRVFGKTSPGTNRFNGDAAGLRKAISSQLSSIRSPNLEQVVSQWLKQLDVPAPRAQAPTLPGNMGRAQPEPTPDYPGASSKPEPIKSLLKLPPPDYEGAEPGRDYQGVEYRPLATLIDGKEQAHRVQIRREDGGPTMTRVRLSDAQGQVRGKPLLKQFVEEGSEARFSTGEMANFWESALLVPETRAVIPPDTLKGVVELLDYSRAWTKYQLGVTAARPTEPEPPPAAVLAAVIQASGISFA